MSVPDVKRRLGLSEKKKARLRVGGPIWGKDEAAQTGSQDSPEALCLAVRYGLPPARPFLPAKGDPEGMSSDWGPGTEASSGWPRSQNWTPTPHYSPTRTPASKGSGQALTRELIHCPEA